MDELESLAGVRRRPGMFMPDVLGMAMEVVSNAFDPYLRGQCTKISLTVGRDDVVTVVDDGPGIPADGRGGLPPLETVLRTWSPTPTVDAHRPHVHLGPCWGAGLFVVNALCEFFEVTTVCDGQEATALCSRGYLRSPIAVRATDEPSGTRVRFRPDAMIFPSIRMPRGALSRQLEDLAFLAPGLSLTWSFEGDQLASQGLAGRVQAIDERLLGVAHHKGVYSTPAGDVDVEVALGWRDTQFEWLGDPVIDSFVNFGRTARHGEHVKGLLQGVAAFVPGALQRNACRGLVAAVSVVLADVKLGSPVRDRLENPEVRPAVAQATGTALEMWAAACADSADVVRTRIPKRAKRRKA